VALPRALGASARQLREGALGEAPVIGLLDLVIFGSEGIASARLLEIGIGAGGWGPIPLDSFGLRGLGHR
jgi:hypothetical protein